MIERLATSAGVVERGRITDTARKGPTTSTAARRSVDMRARRRPRCRTRSSSSELRPVTSRSRFSQKHAQGFPHRFWSTADFGAVGHCEGTRIWRKRCAPRKSHTLRLDSHRRSRSTSFAKAEAIRGESPMPFNLLQRKRTHFVPKTREPTVHPYHRHVPGRKPTELSAAEQVRSGCFAGLGRSMGSGGRSLRAGEQPRLSLLVRSHQREPEDAGARRPKTAPPWNFGLLNSSLQMSDQSQSGSRSSGT